MLRFAPVIIDDLFYSYLKNSSCLKIDSEFYLKLNLYLKYYCLFILTLTLFHFS
jgi:hypothetical protein